MALTIPPSRNRIVADAFAGLRADERRLTRIHKAYQKKPAEPQATPAPSKKPKPPRSKGGKPSKGKS